MYVCMLLTSLAVSDNDRLLRIGVQTYTTMERPNAHFNAAGQMTHLNVAVDLMTQDAGCPAYEFCPFNNNPRSKKAHSKCACTSCKYADHTGSIIIGLDLD